jgi:hypothetical protein
MGNIRQIGERLSSCLSDDFWFFNIWARHHFWACVRCHLKFFTPRELGRKLVEAEQNMQERFDSHKCRPDDVGVAINPLTDISAA